MPSGAGSSAICTTAHSSISSPSESRWSSARTLAKEDSEISPRLAVVAEGLDGVLTEVRNLARGVHPPVLRDYGLRPALASAARRCTPPAALVADEVGRLPAEIETAVYFCCLEGLQNVGKHAGANAHAEVRLFQEPHELRFEVVDDGVGCDLGLARHSGTGLANMSERMAAVGGTLNVVSASGHGTQLRGRIPLGRP